MSNGFPDFHYPDFGFPDWNVKVTQTKTFTLDLIVVNRRTKTLTLDTLIQLTTTKTFSLDLFVEKTQTKNFTLDTLIKLTSTKTFSLDLLTEKTSTKSFTLDTLIKKTSTKTFKLDVLLEESPHVTLSLDLITKKTNNVKQFSLDLITSSGGEVGGDGGFVPTGDDGYKWTPTTDESLYKIKTIEYETLFKLKKKKPKEEVVHHEKVSKLPTPKQETIEYHEKVGVIKQPEEITHHEKISKINLPQPEVIHHETIYNLEFKHLMEHPEELSKHPNQRLAKKVREALKKLEDET